MESGTSSAIGSTAEAAASAAAAAAKLVHTAVGMQWLRVPVRGAKQVEYFAPFCY